MKNKRRVWSSRAAKPEIRTNAPPFARICHSAFCLLAPGGPVREALTALRTLAALFKRRPPVRRKKGCHEGLPHPAVFGRIGSTRLLAPLGRSVKPSPSPVSTGIAEIRGLPGASVVAPCCLCGAGRARHPRGSSCGFRKPARLPIPVHRFRRGRDAPALDPYDPDVSCAPFTHGVCQRRSWLTLKTADNVPPRAGRR